MYLNARDRRRLENLSQNKPYRDAYLSTHVRSSIAYQIRALREALGLNQKDFAEKLGTTQSVVSRLENPDHGKLTVQTLLQVASALDIALTIRFCDYPWFLLMAAQMAPEKLGVQSIHASLAAYRMEYVRSSSTQPNPFLMGQYNPSNPSTSQSPEIIAGDGVRVRLGG